MFEDPKKLITSLIKCKRVNLVVRQELQNNQRKMLSVNKRSHVIRYMPILQIFGTSKKLRFLQKRKEVLNQLNSAN